VVIFGRGRKRAGVRRGSSAADTAHLEGFIATRRGVEAYVEPRTTVTETTVLLVAADGEWTRRRVDGPKGAAEFARRAKVPLYEVSAVGYPQRMRDWNARRKSGQLEE
jgi:hypothetical protein